MEDYKTVLIPDETELEIKKSRFINLVFHIEAEAEAERQAEAQRQAEAARAAAAALDTDVSGAGVITGSDVRMRDGAGLDSGVIGVFSQGESVEVLGSTRADGPCCSSSAASRSAR